MKARFLALAALLFGMAACQTEPAFDVNMGDGTTTISVVLPEDAITRAVARTDSSLGGLANTSNETLRVIFQVYDEDGVTNGNLRQEKTLGEDELQANFDVRLVPGRKYTFVAWADQGEDYFDATDLMNVQIESWKAMDECRDAFTATHTETNFSSASDITLELKRPFAKLRVVTTDMAELGYLGITPYKAEFAYEVALPNAFNAFAGEVCATSEVKTFTYDIAAYSAEAATNTKTLFSDYILVPADGIVKFTMDTQEASGRTIKENAFTTDIPVKRNNLTTIAGNILTDGDNIKVEVKPDFDNGNNWNPDEDNKDIQTISSEAELVAAANTGRKYIIISDFNVTGATASTLAATRATEAKTTIIDLNGKTITVNNQGTNAVINLGGNALIFSGEGTIEGDGKLVEGGTVVVTGSANVDEDVADVMTGIDALKYILANGGEFTMTNNLEATEVLLASATKPVILNGNNKTISTSANRIVRITNSNADVTINDVNFVSSAVMAYPSDVRGVAIDPNLSNVALTLNNCSIDFTDKTTNDWTYAVNIAGNGTGHKVTVNGGTYEGANVINAHGAKNTIIVKNATLNCLYPNNDMYSGACIWVLQNQNSSVYAEGNTFNGNNAFAFNLGTGTALEEKNNTDNTKYVAAKVNGAYYYNIAEAIAAAEDGATVKVLQSHDCTVGATVPTGKTLTLDLNGKTVEGTDTITGSFGLITNKGNLTVKNGTITLKAENNRGWNAYSSVISNNPGGNLVVENVTIEHLGGTDMAYGIDNLTNGKGTSAVATINNGAVVKSCYRAIRQFLNGIEATNELYVNPGAVVEGANKSIWMQDPSAKANTGKLVVNEGATLNGDVYLFVTAGSTEWPVEVSIAASAVNGEVLTGNVPAGYEVVKKGGIWTVVAYTEVSTADELVAALKANKNVIFANDITVAATDGGYHKAGILQNNAQTINGNGHTLTVTGAGATWDCAIYTNGGLIKNLTVAGAMRGVFTAGTSSDLFMENVTFKNVIYTFNSDGGNKNYGVYVSNSTLNGWTSHSDVHKEVVYTDCSFGEGSGYAYCRPYGKTAFVNCTFSAGYSIDKTRTTELTFANCIWE